MIPRMSDEVRTALSQGKPVLALESTVISHGLPSPRNLEVATGLERLARSLGVVPATCAVMDGRICAGLEPKDLERLAREPGVAKVSRRDLAMVVGKGLTGATTVSATMWIANGAGIRVFSTGGIGGVHRHVERSMDVSADLYELGRTPIVVVCAGAKAILDLARTAELLETLGVPVVGYGTDRMPAFYSRSSGVRVHIRVESAHEVAALARAQAALGLEQGILVTNPVPADREIPARAVDGWIGRAERDARRAGVHSAQVTPYLLARLAQVSGGRTLETNVALLENNVRLGCEIAAALSQSPGARQAQHRAVRRQGQP